VNYLPRLASNIDPPDFYLLSSWDYKCEPLVPGCLLVLKSQSLGLNPDLPGWVKESTF
jgi:hypothetical protein